jgi:hypothetical protein
MSQFSIEAERIIYILESLDDYIQYLSDIYKCPCENCIKSNTEKINSIINYIISFYNFIISNREFIKQNDNYFIQIKNLVINMIKFNDIIIKDLVYINKQKSVSIIYIEEEENKDNNSADAYIKPFSIDTFIKYYPEMDLIF